MKCKKCRHYYKTMIGQDGVGYNPYPYCHYHEDTGKRPNILTQECYKAKQKNRAAKVCTRGGEGCEN